MLPPPEIVVQTGLAAAVAAVLLFFPWPWRERGWPVPVALGLGVAACLLIWKGVPALWPEDRTDRLFHLAVLGAALGAICSSVRVSDRVRWTALLVVALGVAWALLLPKDPAWKIGLVGLGFSVTWGAIEWRAARVEGPGVPAALLVVAAAGTQALYFGRSAFLAQVAGALAAALVPLLVRAFRRRSLSVGRGGITAFVLVALPLWICGWRLAKLPLESAALLAVAPIAAQRRWWVGALVAAAAASYAAYVAHAANPGSPW